MTNFRPGDKVKMWPGDTYAKVGKILHISENGWEFEILKGTHENSVYKIGEIVFVSHSNNLTLVKI
jgi:hypothetical protein